jgi:hypothetical protein
VHTHSNPYPEDGPVLQVRPRAVPTITKTECGKALTITMTCAPNQQAGAGSPSTGQELNQLARSCSTDSHGRQNGIRVVEGEPARST